MSVIKIFDEWYEKLTPSQQSEVLKYVINNKCQISCEGFHAGSHGILQKGLFVAPSGNLSQTKCAVCGK
jgi:hypothetical protein